jgi:hypothetical protein
VKWYLYGLVAVLASFLIGYAICLYSAATYHRGYINGFDWGTQAIRGEACQCGCGHWEFSDYGKPVFVFNEKENQ